LYNRQHHVLDWLKTAHGVVPKREPPTDDDDA
jgi:hypothetical protein